MDTKIAAVPLVSLGVPVYNGENFIGDALESIYSQTLSDLEIIICDNASTDATEEICREYSRQDSRTRYFRNEENLGAGRNFNLAFQYSSGRYFKWMCHDDVMEPSYLERMVEILEADPTAALCHSTVKVIDSLGRTLSIHDSGLVGADSPSASSRFATMALQPHQCLELDGVIRSSMLAKTELVPSFAGGDRSLLCEIALLGRIRKVSEPLFLTREHEERMRRATTTPEQRLLFYDTSRRGQRSIGTLELYASYWRMAGKHPANGRERFRCRMSLLQWWFVNWNFARVIVDVLAVISPGILTWSERVKQSWFSPEPGPDISNRDQRTDLD